MPNSISSDMTKRLMGQSLKKLMAEKPLDKITIREITEDCGLNRQTFYYHFEDIYDLVRWMYHEEAIALIADHEGMLLWQDGILQLFRYIEENRAVSLSALNSMSHLQLKNFFYEDIHAVVEKAVLAFAEQGVIYSKEYSEFLAQVYSLAFAALIESWLLGDLQQTPEELIEYMDTALNDQIRGALLRNGKIAPP